MTIRFNNVYVNGSSTVSGPYEAKGPLIKYFDKSYDDLYMGAKTWEQAETKILGDSVDILLSKVKQLKEDIHLFIGAERKVSVADDNK